MTSSVDFAPKQLKLPDRREITLCEAVTVVVCGKASDALQYMLHEAGTTEEQNAKAKDLIERLHQAAYAGRIKFRALKNGDNHADGHKDIDHLYFSEERGFRWELDEIWVRDLSPRHLEMRLPCRSRSRALRSDESFHTALPVEGHSSIDTDPLAD